MAQKLMKLKQLNILHELMIVQEYALEGHESVGKAICEIGEELQAVGIVIAAHKQAPLAEFLLGSVSTYCARHSSRPVVILHCD